MAEKNNFLNIEEILEMRKINKILPYAGIEEILLAKKLMNSLVNKTITGNPLSFTTKKAQTAKSTKISFEPIQEGTGTPSPTNIRPITGRTSVEIKGCGKNRIETVADNVLYRNRVNSLTFNDSVITYTPTASASTSFFLLKAFKITSDMVGKKYTYSFNSSPQLSSEHSSFVICDDDGDNRVSKSNGFTITDAYVGENLTVRFYSVNGAQTYTISQIQVEEGESASDFEPYAESNDIAITFGETVYGGTLDVETGELVVDKGIVNLGTLNWSYSSATDCFYNRSIENLKYNSTPLCTCLWPRAPITANSQALSMANNRITFKTNIDDRRIYAKYTDAGQSGDAFKTAMAGQYLCYELATPTTISSLTPEQVSLLKGVNNIWTDGNSIELTYKAPKNEQ